ncbi:MULTISPECIES: type II toxin-antitoxin system death-on-curing family toxin [unclassified Campylobacter]|uniref:type II toxin-antitoxin system death-on-curing family toxin n=1 Tax=unclassified Campylobacter TaxID=2593542 RepID=UPI001B5551C7|nr:MULTISPECIES: Fic family protein [unclassified Campylobacter]MBP3223901.1 type II toxin-antitoxin system death-on-curing family toxin [Campylobacter sp.]MDA3042795.1 Fic family protein [Campylobacter sp. JMF_09 ED2]MDA3044370.1 Fic family protein [Campylobacter sp. JMF_07 ED4]MDA3049509.1 Fic family protein [Campylobacter sp. JMF_15 NE4]MDA3051064.1 Fic family protein [Campylobacter sp. JMF_02 ED1]
MKYLTLNQAISLHDGVLEKMGGLIGYNNAQIGYLASALENIKNDLYYPSIAEKVTHLMFSCVKFHPFLDGNKRSAIMLSKAFLIINEAVFDKDSFYEFMENIVVSVADGSISKEKLQEIFENLLKI